METETKPSNTFSTLLQNHRGGWALDEASEKLQKVVEGVRQTGKSGTLTIKLKVSPASRGAANALIITDDIKEKIPVLDKDSSIFFATNDNQLVRDNPNQAQLPLRTVEAPAPVVAKAPKAVVNA
jgi:hypothetical protein